MPLVRVQVRNEYGLGQPELYREANREDPKAVLDGVAVAGLAGILRQLGDLAEFAADVFHGLQEQVMTTSSRSHKIMVRLQRIEAALPPLEKAILSQKSHLHFAYTAGSVWHAHHKTDQNQFIYSDLPHFIMDSYEECRDPPRLQLLDKFDTGGPGSCLKRYSDPTFFRRASASSSEANVEKVSKDKKARRKKSRTRQRNEVPHGASISNHSDRTQFASLKDDGQVSCSQTVSAFDAIFNSEHGDQSNSFDSRTGSGFIECVFHPTYSMKSEEHEPNNSSFPSSKMHHNAIIDSPVNEHSGVEDVDFPHSSSEEQAGPSSSCVTWVEKTEIVEPLGHHQYDHDESAEMLTVNFDQMFTPEKDAPISEKDTVNFRNVEQIDFPLDNEDTPMPVSGRNHMDDIESEADNYVDALNTIESESETDLDYQTKREVEKSSNFNNHEETQDEINGLTEHRSNRQSSNLEFCKAGYRSSNIAMSGNEAISISTRSYANEESPQIEGKSPEISPFLGMDSGDNSLLDGSNEESIIRNLPSSGLTEPNRIIPMSDKIISTSCESQKSTPEPSGVQSVKFWTNGGLLGLEPSKPPVFSVSNAAIQDSLTRNNNDSAGPSSESWVVNGDGHAGKPDKLVQSSKICEHISCNSPTSRLNDQYGQSDKKVSQRFLSTDVDTNYEELSLSQTTAVKPGTEQAVTANVKAISPEASQRDGENESQIFGFGNRFLINGFQRKRSVVHGEKFEPLTSTKTGDFEEKSKNHSVAYQTFSGRNLKGYFGNESPMSSPLSSPPLQHMKISFQPINGFEISKLKLKFPDGSYSHDGSRDMLPSFQLVPEAATPQHAIGSESDDDTFCRSSPYMSDDCRSHHSDSNSEQWDSDDTPPSKNNELYDALRRISSTETVSSSLEHDLPSLSTLNPLFDQKKENGSDARDFPESDVAEGPTPVPPPLPPLEWRVTNSHSDLTTHMQDTVSETVNRALEMKILGSSVSPQPKPSPTKQQQKTVEAIAVTPKSQPEWQKLNGKKEIDQATNDRGDDEKEDFLQQIRAKSFNLRRTATEKATIASGPTANVKVAAILEKANAIRQAVGSDDGEDDNWSDT